MSELTDLLWRVFRSGLTDALLEVGDPDRHPQEQLRPSASQVRRSPDDAHVPRRSTSQHAPYHPAYRLRWKRELPLLPPPSSSFLTSTSPLAFISLSPSL
jgi:hypothetical protein